MENKKQVTSVEFIIAHLIDYGFDLSHHKLEIEKAKEMEKQNIELSFLKGFMSSADGYNGETLECELITDENVKSDAKDYYSKTFNK